MKFLSNLHKKRISEGLCNSNTFKKSQQNKNVNGRNNPNWKLKVIYYCPACNKKMIVTKKKRAELIKKNRTCSKKCGAIIGANKRKGRKNPEASLYMQNFNPKFQPNV